MCFADCVLTVFFSKLTVVAAGKDNMNPLDLFGVYMRQRFCEGIVVTVGYRQLLSVPSHPTNHLLQGRS
jgi:hypothetical protein